jgi:hypothetical protein
VVGRTPYGFLTTRSLTVRTDFRAGDGPHLRREGVTRYELAVRYEATVLVEAINEWL